jgi:hypothetical protein
MVIVLTRHPPTSPPQAAVAESSPVSDLRPVLKELEESIKAADHRLQVVEAKFDKLQQAFSQSVDEEGMDFGGEIELQTKRDAEILIDELGKSPTADKFADALATVDGWIVSPDEGDSFQSFKASQIIRLRQLVKTEVDVLHEQALKSDNGTKAAEFHAKASQILALFPMESVEAVLDEARTLASRHSEVGVRIDVLRRQRYNAWAMSQIEEAIKAINSIASSFRTSDNPKTIEATVKHLGEVDPLLLEPVIAQLYNYAVEQAKGNVDSEQQLELGRRMIDPAIKRKGYGDF